MNPQIFVLGKDIFALGKVQKFLNVNEMKTFNKSKLITNTYNIPVINDDNYFSVNNPKSDFKGANWRYSTVTVNNSDGNKIWEGAIYDIKRNYTNQTAEIICKNTYFGSRNNIINYQSSTWETGASTFKNVCDSIGFTKYNLASINTSDSQLDENGCKIMCDFQTADNKDFTQVIETIAEYSNAYLYVHNDELYFVHWVPFTGGISTTINGDREGVLKKAPIITSPEREIVNEYSIDYFDSGKIPATDANSNNLGVKSRNKFGNYPMKTFRTGNNQQIVFMDKQSAIYIGEGYMRKTNRNIEVDPEPPERNEFSLFVDNDDWMNLQSFFEFTFTEEGYNEKIFETFNFTVDEDNDELAVVAYGV
jgi:hypothetical protein